MNEILEKLKTALRAVSDMETVMPQWDKGGVERDLDEVIALVEGGHSSSLDGDGAFELDNGPDWDDLPAGPYLLIPLKQPLQPTEQDRQDALHAIAAWVGVGANEIQVAKVEAAAIVLAKLRRDRGEA